MYLEDKSENAEIFQILHDDLSVASTAQTPETDQPDVSKVLTSQGSCFYFKTSKIP